MTFLKFGSIRFSTAAILAVGFLISVVTAAGPFPKTDAVTLIDIEHVATAEQFLDRLEPFGLNGTVLVAQGEDVFINRAFGLADARTGVPNSTATLFSTGSVTKQFTAAAVLDLEVKGKLSVDDPITAYFENVPEDKQAITVHHLLTHTAGLRPAYGSDEDPITRQQLVRLIFDTPLELPPGQQYQYSNGGYSLLAAIVEIVSGVEYETYLRDTFFAPLAMRATGLHDLSVEPERVSRSHNPAVDFASPLDRPEECWFLEGNGGILSTTSDMLKWCRALRDGLVLPESALERMFTPWVLEYQDGTSFYGYGWVVDEYKDGKRLVWHNGGSMPQGWGCTVYHFVDDDLLFVVFTNKTIEGIHPADLIVKRLASILIGTGTPLPPALGQEPVSGVAAASHAGTYALAGGGLFRVTSPGGYLLIRPEGQPAVSALFPSPYSDRLPQYNDLTVKLVTAIAGGDVDKALEFFDTGMATKGEWQRMIKEWWGSLRDMGEFVRIEPVGTIASDGAHTHCRLYFSEATIDCRFFWMAGQCGGIRPNADPPERELLGQTPNRFVSYSLTTGTAITVDFPSSNRLVIEQDDTRIEAVRNGG